MATFLENFRVVNQRLNPTNQLENRRHGYVPANQAEMTPKQSANFSQDALGYYLNEYNKTNDWDRKEAIVNAIMESYPNPDDNLKNWVKTIDKRTKESKDQYDLFSWGVNAVNSTRNLDEKRRIVNYLMEKVPTPSKWYRNKVVKLNDSVEKGYNYSGDLDDNITINEIGRYSR